MEIENEKCETCGELAHNYELEEHFECVPPRSVLVFGDYVISADYREALYTQFPIYNSEEVVGSYLGYNPWFLSEPRWLEASEEDRRMINEMVQHEFRV